MKQPATKNKRINLWQYQFILARRLAWWGALSFAVGIPSFLVEPALRGFGLQMMVGGLLMAVLAVGGSLLIIRRRKALRPASERGHRQRNGQFAALVKVDDPPGCNFCGGGNGADLHVRPQKRLVDGDRCEHCCARIVSVRL